MGKEAEKKTGLFLACYEIGGEMPGAPLFKIHFAVYAPDETLSGTGHITLTTKPPLDIGTMLVGQYTYMCVMPKTCHILITASGYPPVEWPSWGGVGPVIPSNVKLTMVIGDDWKSGTANYSYRDQQGNWVDIKDAPVKLVPCNTIEGD